MNRPPAPSIVARSRHGRAEVVAPRLSAIRLMLAHVRDTMRAGAAPDPDDLAGTSARLLRDIGAEARYRPAPAWQLAVRGSIPLLMALVLVAAVSPASRQPPCVVAKAPTDATLTAQFTGRFEAGTPVYRLGGISVTASRKVTAVEAPIRNGDAIVRPVRRGPPS
ncbi:MAG TPA: hypothetical protein VL742_08660 [Casimicrobiaceae bacterium]|nr:hypothetical protein [Casimicrobiaceae bacterium]